MAGISLTSIKSISIARSKLLFKSLIKIQVFPFPECNLSDKMNFLSENMYILSLLYCLCLLYTWRYSREKLQRPLSWSYEFWRGGYYQKQPPTLPKNKIPLLARSWTTEFWQATKLIVILNILDNIHVMCGILSMIKPISLIFCAL